MAAVSHHGHTAFIDETRIARDSLYIQVRFPWVLIACFATVSAASAQFHAGVALGIPFTDTLNSSSTNLANGVTSSFDSYNSDTKRIVAGPVLRMQFSKGWGMEFDALWQRVDYDHASYQFGPGSLTTQTREATAANRWQFPLLAQYARHHVFAEGGLSISHIGDSHSIETVSTASSSSSSAGSGPSITQPGVTVGGGADVRFLRGHLRPELRYTHWFGQAGASGLLPNPLSGASFALAGFHTNPNEVTFLLNWTL